MMGPIYDKSNALSIEQHLLKAQQQAKALYEQVQHKGLIQVGRTECEVSDSIFELAKAKLGIEKYWHKRIVRTGMNTLCPYRENPPNLELRADDVVFLDFGPIFAEENGMFEADLGRTYVLGEDPEKHRLVRDLSILFEEAKHYYLQHPGMTGEALYNWVCHRSQEKGWQYGGPHAGHLIGTFPHEIRCGEGLENYIAPGNHMPMNTLDPHGQPRHWILEIHLVHPKVPWGGFYEELLTLSDRGS
jgi:Xaa-Pro dipeptidase